MRVEVQLGKAPSVHAEWVDEQRSDASTYTVTLTMDKSFVPNQPAWSISNTTKLTAIKYNHLDTGAKYTLEVSNGARYI